MDHLYILSDEEFEEILADLEVAMQTIMEIMDHKRLYQVTPNNTSTSENRTNIPF